MRTSSKRNRNKRLNQNISPRKPRSVFAFERLDARMLMSGDIQVSIYQDVNRNGLQDAGDTPQSGWTVFLDNNGNGALDSGELSQVSGSNGIATFAGLPNKTYDVVEVMKPGFTIASNFNISKKASVSNNVRPILFMNKSVTNGAIQGTLWNDIDGNGTRDSIDPAQAGWTVFLDTNNNRQLDAGETSSVTDSNGLYSFSNLVPGGYRVREVLQAGFAATTGFNAGVSVSVGNGALAIQDFGNFNAASVGSISGVVWNDVNADGIREIGDPALSGWTTFIDTNSNGTLDAGEQSAVTDANGTYRFPIVFPGAYNVREVPQPTWLVSPTFHNPATVNIVGGVETITDFANFTPVAGTATGTVYKDINGNGFMDAGDPGISGWTVYADANTNGILDAGELSTTTSATGAYTLTGLPLGSSVIREITGIGYLALTPGTGAQLLTVLNGATVSNVNFGNQQRTDGAISGTAFADSNHNGVRDAGEHGLAGITIYQDTNNNGSLDAGEPSTITSADLFYTPAVDEAGAYTFTHLANGIYNIREIVPANLSGTPAAATLQTVDLLTGENRMGVDFADQYRANEIHGIKFNDLNNNHVQDAGEPGMAGVTIYLDLNRNDTLDASEPTTVTAGDGSYAFTGLSSGAYVVREVLPSGHSHTYPTTGGGILWPTGVSNPASGNVTPTSITTSLAQGQTYTQTVSLTLPTNGAITNKADVFLLFDDTGSFTANSPIVRAAFPEIINSLQAGLPGLDLGFGVGRFEEYGNFAAEFGSGRPFILNQPIVSSTTTGFSTSIQAALDRTAPGYGGDLPESDIEALFQMVTGRGFDGNNNGTTTDSGAAGQAATQVTPGNSGDVPAFSSFTPDPTNSVLPAEGSVGGAGFRDGALPIILLATDTGFNYQPKGETSITGVNGLTLPISQLTQSSRNTTPFGSGAGIQETVTGLNALGALVIGLGTNAQTNIDPRQQLQSLAKLTGAINQSTTPIVNGTGAPILPGDPLYFQIASGFGASVANGVVSAIQNAATSVAVNVTLKASDPRVHITFNPGVINSLTSGQTATFNVTFTGDGLPHRFDLQFVREGTSVVLGSIPVVLGTPIAGEGYEFEDLPEGEIHRSSNFGSFSPSTAITASASGRAYDDRNANGVQDTGEGALAGVTIYADLNNSGSFDIGEPSGTSSSTGDYSITGLATGAVTLRQADGSGRIVTNTAGNAVSVTLAAGTTLAENDFGSFPTLFTSTLASTYYVKSTGILSQIWVNSNPSAQADYSIATSTLPSLSFAGSSAADSVTIDLSQSSTSPAGGYSFDGGAGLDTLTVVGSAGNDIINASNTSVTLNGSAVNFTGIESSVLNPGTGVDSLAIGSGSFQLAASTAAGITPRLFSSVSLGASASLKVGTPAIPASRSVLSISTLSIAPLGSLDLGNSDLVVHNGNAATISAWIASGMNASGGIVSSTAATNPLFQTALGAILNDTGTGQALYSTAAGNLLGGFDGQPTLATDVLVKYTYFGDSDLSGKVDGSDYSRIDSGFSAGKSGWSNGDFNLDGTINGSDYTLIDNIYNTQGATIAASLPTAKVASQIASVVANQSASDSTHEKHQHRKMLVSDIFSDKPLAI